MNIRTSTARFLPLAFIVAVSVLIPARADAQWVLLEKEADQKVRGGFDALYNLRYEEADTLFMSLTRSHPDHPAGYFLLALVDWWRIVPNLDDNPRAVRYTASFNRRLERVIEISDERLDRNPRDIVGLFFKGAALGYQARLKILTSSGAGALMGWGSAALDGKEALDLLLECQRLAPSNSDILLGSGIFSYMSAALPEQYPASKAFLGFLPPGDKTLGLQMLRISSQRAQYASVEAKYALLDIVSGFEKNYQEALQISRELHERYPGNPVFHRYLAKAYYMTSDFAMADTVYHEILTRVRARQHGYEMTLARQALYYLGDIKLRLGDYPTALRILQEAEKQSKRLDLKDETSWRVLAALKMGNVYDLLGKRAEAVRKYKEVLSLEDQSNSRARAREYIAKPYQR